MSLDQIPAFVTLTLVCVIGALGLWYLGIRRNSRSPKRYAVGLALFPVLIIGIELLSPLLRTRPEFRDTVVLGSARDRVTFTTTETRFEVTAAQAVHRMELTPKAWGSYVPAETVRMTYQVRSPSAEIVGKGEQDFAPAPDKRLRWTTSQTTFNAREEGTYTLVLTVPPQVGSVDIRIRER